MICKICGKQLPEGSNVCKYCGAHVRANAAPEKKPARRYSKKALARKRIINLIVSLLALLMIAAVVVGVVWSARMAGDKGAAGDQTLQQNDQQAEEPDDSGDAEDPADTEEEDEAPERPQGSIIQQRPQEQDSEKGTSGDTAEQPSEQDQPAESTEPEGQTGTATQPQSQNPSGNYTISINRTETTASLNHYRELIVSINEPLAAGVSIVSTTWTSSNPNVVRAEPGKAWGVSVGSATVTGTITLSDGQTLSATCKVNVVESQTGTGTGTTTVSGDYVFADSSSRLLTAAELDNLSTYQLWIARNEIYARHGRKFTNADLASYFAGKSWYKGTIEAANFDESLLSSIERQNVDAILAEEASR